jgi:predicted nucleic acid-binding protein
VSVVIDANALVAFVTNEPAAPKVTELLHGWGSEGTAVNAPALARYEIANALAKKAAAGSLSDDAMQEAWGVLDELPIVYHALRDGPGVVRFTLVLERRSAYDAAISLSPMTWALSCGRSMGRSPETPARAAIGSV